MRCLFVALLFASLASLALAQCKDGSSQYLCGPKAYCCCSRMDPNAQGCSIANGVTSCRNNYILSNGKCVQTCPARTYASSGKCIACRDGNAQTCDGGGYATSCANNMALSGSTCVSTCPQRTYRLNSICHNCADANAVTCSTTAATSCGGSTALYQGRCVNPCPDGFFSSANVCQACTGNSQTCNASGALSCKAGFFLNAKACLTTCPTGYYTNTNTRTCDKCPDADAKSCSSDGLATACSTKNLYQGKCIPTCPIDHYTIYGSHVCTPCGTNQATCDKNGALSCKKGFLTNKVCVDACDAGFYGDKKALTCVACSSINVNALTCKYTLADGPEITSCTNGFGLSAGECIKPCPVRYYLADSGICTKCKDADASQCNSDVATKCTFKYLTPAGACAATCPEEFYANLSQHACLPCSDPDARTCSSTKSLSCKTKYLEDGVCKDECSAGSIADLEKHTCSDCPQEDAASCDQDGATSCSTKYLSNKACVDVCPAATFPDEEAKECAPCGDGVTRCTRDEVQACGLKKDGTQLYLVKGACVAQCKDGYFGGASTEPEAATRLRRRHRVRVNIKKRDTSPIVAPTCQKCPDGVATCSSQTVALTCTTDSEGVQTYLDSATTSCVVGEKCSPLTFASTVGGKFVCAACPTGSTTCSLTGEALSCETPLLVSAGKCVDSCPVSTFANKGVCSACGPSATQCTSATFATACGKNQDGVQTYLLNGKCQLVKECPNSWGYIEEVALACKRCDQFSPGSLTCNAEGALSCGKVSGVQYYLTSNKNCVAAAACPSGTWGNPSGNVCTSCDDGTKLCSKSGPGGAIECSTTSSGEALYLDTTTYTCISTCPDTFYPDSLSSKCIACDEGEKHCTGNGSGDAISCEADHFLTPAKDCVTAQGCASLGPYFGNTATVDPVCSTCDPGVLACTGNGAGLATKCGVDPVTQVQLYLDPSNNCVTKEDCPISTFINDSEHKCSSCQKGALVCDSEVNALQCGTVDGIAYYLDAGSCVQADGCQEGTGPSAESGVCQDCVDLFEHSLSCKVDQATSCVEGYNLFSGRCVICPQGTFPDDVLGCASCSSRFGDNIKSCTPEGITECQPNTWVSVGLPGCSSCQALFGSTTVSCDETGPTACQPGSFVYQHENRCALCKESFGPSVKECTVSGPTSCEAAYAITPNGCFPIYARSRGWAVVPSLGAASIGTRTEEQCALVANNHGESSWNGGTRDCVDSGAGGGLSNVVLEVGPGEDRAVLYRLAGQNYGCEAGAFGGLLPCEKIYWKDGQCLVYGSNSVCTAV